MRIKTKDFNKISDKFIKMTGIREHEKLAHTPFIVLLDKIEICENLKDLIEKYPPETEVIKQWQGEWSSDFFHFTIKEIINYITENPRSKYQII